MMASALLANAPMREMKRSSFGIKMASPAANKTASLIKYRGHTVPTCYCNDYNSKNRDFNKLIIYTQPSD